MPLDQPEEELPGAEMSFMDHLEALRWHLIRSVIAIVLVAVVAFNNSKILFDGILLAPKDGSFATYRFLCWLSMKLFGDESLCMNDLNVNLININMSGQFTMHLKVSFITGLVVAFPYILWEIWRFIRPALYPKERLSASGLVFWGSLLFLCGIAFGYYVISPISVYFFGSYQASELITNQISAGSFIDVVVNTTFGTGLVFELPIVIYFLAKVGIVTAAFLKRTRKISYVIILILAAIVTPPDVASQIIVAIPLFLLYEISIVIARRVEKRNI